MEYKVVLSKLLKYCRYQKHYKLLFHNCYPHHWFESDFLAINNSNFMHEYEIKLSKADYNNDFSKKIKHSWLSGNRTGIIKVDKLNHSKYVGMDMKDGKYEYSYILDELRGPNYFWYVCPENLIKVEDIPNYAGLLYIMENELSWCRIIKDAPRLHKNKIDEKHKTALFKSLMYKYWNIIEKTSCDLEKN